jgi:hypothetical protein
MLNRPPDTTPAAELEMLAVQVRRLRLEHSESYYEARSEFCFALVRLSRRLSAEGPPKRLIYTGPSGTARPGQAESRRVTSDRDGRNAPRCAAARVPQASLQAKPSRPRQSRHRYPRPPALPPTVQLRFL